ncbi:DUF3489 domain-containing protein [Euryhalocaulis caribicus]|uniref:DUF3489 domain-containing protein n=1 Tax=Euryhalocaulis caribicus TaxID=1161401 RepID=UPI0003A8527C|nr:DUF3489 domain-containing protein [Euryhalocaulis caribicus]
MSKSETKKNRTRKTPAKATGTAKAEIAPAQTGKTPRPDTTRARLQALLRSGDGATVAELGKAIGWQDHSVRAALTGLRKDGIAVERLAPRKDERASRYRIASSAG